MYALSPPDDWPKYQYTGLSTNGQLHHGEPAGCGAVSELWYQYICWVSSTMFQPYGIVRPPNHGA